MIWSKLSKKQRHVFTWWANENYDAIIADGSIRSGKTICMACSFILWAMTCFDAEQFAICGKTIGSLRRNVVLPLMEGLNGICKITEKRAENCLLVEYCGHKNRFYLFGGKDESSYMLIQGITLAGVLFDEVALQPQSFVNQALGRCSVDGSKFWFNCNPDSPSHWFYTDWVLKAEERNALRLHFTMSDNLSLSEKVRKRYESQFSGIFYDRYILGEWVKAEGRVYPMFEKSKNTFTALPKTPFIYFVSIDYGTYNPFSAGLWAVDRITRKAYRLKEFYYDGRADMPLTDEEYYSRLEAFIGSLPVKWIIIDPSAASFIATVRRHGKYQVRKAENDVINGIRVVATMLQSGMISVHESCKDAIREFGLYCWNEKSTDKDAVIKENDHAMDDIRYFCATVLSREFKWAEWK